MDSIPSTAQCADIYRAKVIAVSIFVLSLVIVGGFSVYLVLVYLFVVCAGLRIGSLLMELSNGELLWNFLESLLGESMTIKESIDEHTTTTPLSNDSARKMPWQGVLIAESVNEALEELIEQIIHTYVNSWYRNDISNDPAFLNEIRYQIRFASATALESIKKQDIASIILSDAVPVAVVHAERVARIGALIDTHVFPRQMVETKILEDMEDMHYALTCRQNEMNYLRQVADHILARLVDDTRVAGRASDDDSPFNHNSANRVWPSHGCRHFLRELIVFSFLLPLLDLIADPDTINHLLILLFDPEPMDTSVHSQPKMVEILHGLTEYSLLDAPDSLLHLKLSEILRDCRQMNMFKMYLKDVRGPTNELFFLLHSSDVHERMLNLQEDSSAINELHYDIWEIFSKYVHNAAIDHVHLPSEVHDHFKYAIETRNMDMLDRAIEKAYQIVYARVQHDYVVPFCQSECYLGHLCGSPPISVDELMFINDKSGLARRLCLSGTETAFSLSQFRHRLWKVLIPSSVDGSLDSTYDRLSDLGSQPMHIEVANDASAVAGSHPSSEFLMQQFTPLPSIDVTCEEEPCDSSLEAAFEAQPSPGSNNSLQDEERGRQSRCESPSELTLFDPHRDINRWMVTIPNIEPRRDSNGRTTYVYVVSVERFDVGDMNGTNTNNDHIQSNNQFKWSVVRRYNEFYVLESKLVEFHGDGIKADPLPPRRPFATKNRAFIEHQRPHFAKFIQILTRQSLLKRSDLLCMFLTSEQELKDSVQLSDLNPFNMMRKMPGKFTRERGQNVKPFLLSLMATTLAPQSETSLDANLHCGERSETSSISSISVECAKPRNLLMNTIYGNNCPSAKSDIMGNGTHIPWTRSVVDSVVYVLCRVFSTPQWLKSLMVSLRYLINSSIHCAITVLLRRVLNIAFMEQNCVRIINLIQDALFAADQPKSSDQEKSLRAELAQRRTLEYLEEELPTQILKALGQKRFRQGIATLFHALQYPRLNKQLSYLLLDILVNKLMPIKE